MQVIKGFYKGFAQNEDPPCDTLQCTSILFIASSPAKGRFSKRKEGDKLPVKAQDNIFRNSFKKKN